MRDHPSESALLASVALVLAIALAAMGGVVVVLDMRLRAMRRADCGHDEECPPGACRLRLWRFER